MLRLNQRITIDGRVLPVISACTITDTRNDFTNTATLTLPNRISAKGDKITDLIPLGGKVKIELGYFPFLETVFEGYVSQVIPEKTAVITCENEAYNLKRQGVGKDIIQKSTTLKKLITAIYSGKAEIEAANIGDWKISKTSTVIDVLAELQSKLKIYSYFRGSTLIVGANADSREKRTIKAHFQENVPDGESSYNFKEASADRIVVKVSSVNRSGAITEIYAYYDGSPSKIVYAKVAPTSGAVNEFNINGENDLSESSLKELAKIRLEALSFTGVDGTVTVYGGQYPTHGDICQVTDLGVPEKNGIFSVVEVITRFSTGDGFRNDIGLGITI